MENITFNLSFDFGNFGFDEFDYQRFLSSRETTILWAVFSLISVVGLFGNFMVILAVLGAQSMRHSSMNLLLMNMAIADFGNILVCVFDWIQILLFRAPIWSLANFLCPTVRYTAEMFLYASLLTQVAVCVERYLAIKHPLDVARLCGHGALSIWICLIWIISASFASPYIILYRSEKPLWPGGPRMCRTEKPLSLAFKTAECLIFFFLPLCLLVILYSRLSSVLWRDPGYLRDSIKSSGTTAAMARIRGRRRVVKMLVCCVALYFICYSPIQCLFLFHVLFDFQVPPDYFSVVIGLNGLCYASSACNPILYTIFSEKFRYRFQRILFCIPRISKEAQNLYDMVSAFGRNSPVPSICEEEALRKQKPSDVPVSVMAEFHHAKLLTNDVVDLV